MAATVALRHPAIVPHQLPPFAAYPPMGHPIPAHHMNPMQMPVPVPMPPGTFIGNHPGFAQGAPFLTNSVGTPSLPPFAGMNPVQRPVPTLNSFVPLQAVRHSVHKQKTGATQLPPKTATLTPEPIAIAAAAAAVEVPAAKQAVAEDASHVTNDKEKESAVSVPMITPKTNLSKPPGSRLAIRFTSP